MGGAASVLGTFAALAELQPAVNVVGLIPSCENMPDGLAVKPGDVVTIEPGVRHKFKTETGAVIEEISTTHNLNDSFYTDPAIMENKQRKTLLTYWMD